MSKVTVDPTSVAVGSSKTNWGQVGSKPSAKGSQPRPQQAVGVSGGGGGSRKLPSGTYKA